jgi:hypothetical protein
MTQFKTFTASAAAIAVALSSAGIAPAAQAQTTGSGLGSVVNCDAPGNQQRNGAIIGGLLGAVAGAAVAKKDGQGAIVGGLLGAAAGSYVGCQKQRQQGAQGYDNGYDSGYAYGDNRYGGYQTAYGDQVPLARGVQPANFIGSGEQLRAASNVTLRAGPSAGSAKLGQLYAGQTFESLAMVRGGDWVLVGRNGVGVGYVNQTYVQPADYGRYAGGYGR